MKIGFYAASCLPVHAGSLAERPLGGTETGLIHLAAVLHNRGHEVSVFTAHKSPPPSSPRYFPAEEIRRHQPFDLLVTVKDWHPAFFGIQARRIFYWLGDGYEQFVTFGMGDRRVAKRIDKLLAVSTWHRETICARSGFPLEKTAIIGNGIALTNFGSAEPRQRRRLIFTAAPYRGLQLMPQIFSALRQRFSDAELHVFSGLNIYDTDRPFAGPQVEQFKRVRAVLERIPGVVLHGNVTQAVLARELLRSAVFVYPNTVHETCCLTALEAQAAGCPVVASASSALPETVGDAGFVIAGEPGSPEYLQAFVEKTAVLLEDDAVWHAASRSGRERIAREFTWERVADRFEAQLGTPGV